MQAINRPSRTAATDDESNDHIGTDTPGSGIATPQPDPQDKRLPGILSYFGQVREDPSTNVSSSSSCTFDYVSTPPAAAGIKHSMPKHQGNGDDTDASADLQVEEATPSSLPASLVRAASQPSLAPAVLSKQSAYMQPAHAPNYAYPTPPPSQPCSSASSAIHASGLSASKAVNALQTEAAPASTTAEEPMAFPSTQEPASSSSQPLPPLSDTPPPVPPSSSCNDSPQLSSTDAAANVPPGASANNWFSLGTLKELTRGVIFKSGPSTPTRALSTATSQADSSKETTSRSSNDGAEQSGTQTPRSGSGAQVPAARGKLTIKIGEARGLRRCKDPYVVAVFQRSELISGGPRPSDDDEALSGTPSAIGSIPIQRQASDSGRPPMAIPMRSRQSSNTSVSDYNSFRNRPNQGRAFYTSPQWDAEAVFDVVDSDSLVDISVYDHGPNGDEIVGHINLQAPRDREAPLRGWFPLQAPLASTNTDSVPIGEIYVEAQYQRSEKRHFGPTDFEILRLIGKGTFGQVYQVRKKDTQRIYAMKVLQKKVIVQKKEVAHTVGERNILVRTATTESPFIVGLKFSFQTPSELYLVTDYMSGGELFWHLQKEGRFDERRAKFYIAELILAIQHLHMNDIVYRDLKPENILLDANGHIALCDFGLSKANLTKNDTTNTFCGTTEYLAPEVLLDESGYTKMVDFWSLGVLVFEMCCGWSPFYAEDTQQMYKNIAFGKVRFPRDTLSQEGRNFVKGLLNRNPKHRLGATDDAEELKRHPFFDDVDWNMLGQKRVAPPFKPKLKNETDVSYFDPEFTTALEQNGSLNQRAANIAKGYGASTPLSPSVQANFQGFTFVDESALDDHMRDRARTDDEDMDDAHHHNGQEDEWDNLDDIDLRSANRMSGIVKTSSHDEQMVGGAHFDM